MTTPHFYKDNGEGYCEVCGGIDANPIHLVTDRQVAAEYGRETPTDLMPKAIEPGRFAYVELHKIHIEVFHGATENDLRRAQNFLSMLVENSIAK